MDGSCQVISPPAFDFNDWLERSYESPHALEADFSCWRFVRDLVKAGQGVELPTFYERNKENTRSLYQEQQALLGYTRVPLVAAQPFDIIIFRSFPGRVHCGVVVSRGKFIHAGRDNPSCIERYTGYQWFNRIEGLYRYDP